MKYEIIVKDEEADFGPIEAADIEEAVSKTRELLAQHGVWGVEEPFTAIVTIRAMSGPTSTIKLPIVVECNVADMCACCGERPAVKEIDGKQLCEECGEEFSRLFEV